jgi:broad specificity phosphatase PhoE
MPEWIEAYNSAGVKNEVNSSCQEMVSELNHNFIVCSDLERSLHSAKIIGYKSVNLVDSLFREAELTSIAIPVVRLTPHVWSMFFRVFWFVGVSSKVESLHTFKSRTCLAAEKLIQLAKDHESVIFIGHGVINRFLAKELISKGWSGEEAPNGNKYWGYKYWEYAVYTKT